MNIEEDLESAGCQHVRDILVDVSTSDQFIRKFKSMTEWSMHRTSTFKNPAKRRKVWIQNYSLPGHKLT
jgi:hypothetical protein